MTAHRPEPLTEPLAPMPALTPEALHAAVASLTPSRLPAFVQDLVEATTSAQQTRSLAPLRTFVHTWGSSWRSSADPPARRACVTWKRW
ncbi:DUF6247 family protein [Streptomyces olivaceus]|uniref:DUF6247 family protein n=1 Tax=Streptomyces olivaceus TaxID=47716 RepID=UPI0036BE851E